jgi:endonuclease YncB( thermonuclease family)
MCFRRVRLLFVSGVSLLVLVVLSVGSGRWGPARDVVRAQDPPTPPAGLVSALVTFVKDGDTIEVEMDGRRDQVRYIGMDTPERGEAFAQAATEANRQLVESQTVLLETDVSEMDRYGRLLRYVYRQDGAFVNAELLRRGLARVLTYPPDVKNEALFARLEAEARADGLGLWSLRAQAWLPRVSMPLVPTPSPLPTATPAPAPTTHPAVRVLPNLYHHVTPDENRSLRVLGQIENQSSSAVARLRVQVQVFDSAGRLIASEQDNARPYMLPAGERTCFEVGFRGVPEGYDRFEANVSLDGRAYERHRLTLVRHSGRKIATHWERDTYEIRGAIRNDRAVAATRAEVVGMLFDHTDRLVGCGTTYESEDALAPDAEQPFMIEYIGKYRNYRDVARYELLALAGID